MRLFLISLLSFSLFNLLLGQTADWENPKMFNQNKEAPHAAYIPFPEISQALTLKPEQSPWYKSLNGIWKFKWVEKPADAPAEFLKRITMFRTGMILKCRPIGNLMVTEFPFM